MSSSFVAIAVALGLIASPAFAQSQNSVDKKATHESEKATKKSSKSGTSSQPNSTASTQPTAGGAGTSSQPSGSGTTLPSLVTVNLEKVRADIASKARVEISKVPITAQVPVSAAANVCGIDVNALGGLQGSGSQPTCTATNSAAAYQVVQNQMK